MAPPFEALADLLPEPMVLVSSDARIHALNRAFATLVDTDRDGLVGRSLQELGWSSGADWTEYFQRCAGTSALVLGTATLRRRDGTERSYRCEGTAYARVRPSMTPSCSCDCSPGNRALGAALQRLDAAAIDQEIGRLAAALRPLDLLRDVLMPALVRVGDDWHRGRAAIAHEHLMSSTVRSVLGSFLRLYSRPDVPVRLLFATPQGDRHEIGTLGAAMLAASSGLGVTYLGPDLPAREIVQSVKPAGARVLVLGLTSVSRGKTKEQELRTIVRELSKDVELWAGGRGAELYASIIKPRGLVLADYTAYQKELARLGGRVA